VSVIDSATGSSLSGATLVTAGNGTSFALLRDQTVRAWGSNRNKNLGDGTTSNRTTAFAVPGVGR